MNPVDLSSYKKLYLETTKESCKVLSKSCTEVLKNRQNREALNNIHICAHSLRSRSEVMGYRTISMLAGVIENLTKNILDRKGQMESGLLKTISEAVKDLYASIQNIQSLGKELDLTPTINRLKMAQEL